MSRVVWCCSLVLACASERSAIGDSDRPGDAADSPEGDPDPGPPLGGHPLLSRGRPTASNVGSAAQHRAAVDGIYGEAGWSAARPHDGEEPWLAVELPASPAHVLVSWNSGGNVSYDDTHDGAPLAYRLELSADSTDGDDGAWYVALAVQANGARTRVHRIELAGETWVRLVIVASGRGGVTLDELEVFDGAAAHDSWLFLGDSITAHAFARDPAQQPSFAEVVHARDATRFPLMIDGGIVGETTFDALRRIDAVLADHPDVRFVALGYGSNDASPNVSDPHYFRRNLRELIARVQAAGKVALVPRIPYASDGEHDHLEAFNAVVDELTRELDLPVGPDLYDYFRDNAHLLVDGLHPNAEGGVAINYLWAEAVLAAGL